MMQNLPPYSVIIPAYNASKFIAETVASVMAQTHPPAQIIVVDDGSSDDLSAALNGLDALVLLIRQNNSGPGSATTRGVAAATNEFIATIDADDLWQPDKIAQQFEVMEAQNADMVFTRMSSFNEAVGTANVFEDGSGWGRSTLLTSRRIFDLVGAIEDLPGYRGEMVEWLARARRNNISMFMIETPLARRRIHEGSLSWGRSALQDKGYMEIVLRAMRRRKDGSA